VGTGDLPLSLSLSFSLSLSLSGKHQQHQQQQQLLCTYLSSVSKRDRKNKLSILAHSISAALSHFVAQFPDPFLCFSSFESSLLGHCCRISVILTSVVVFEFCKIFHNLEKRQSVLVLLKNQNQRTRQGHAYLNPIKEHATVALI
jgi:hypothetical protein